MLCLLFMLCHVKERHLHNFKFKFKFECGKTVSVLWKCQENIVSGDGRIYIVCTKSLEWNECMLLGMQIDFMIDLVQIFRCFLYNLRRYFIFVIPSFICSIKSLCRRHFVDQTNERIACFLLLVFSFFVISSLNFSDFCWSMKISIFIIRGLRQQFSCVCFDVVVHFFIFA